MKTKTIILLSGKRCGSTVIHEAFRRHPDVNVCHYDQSKIWWEPQFWYLAAGAWKRNKGGNLYPDFFARLCEIHPDFKRNEPMSLQAPDIYRLWKKALKLLGPIIFDKSPSYLSNPKATSLILSYKDTGADVRLIGVVRNPLDQITSQLIMNDSISTNDIANKEEMWIYKYQHLRILIDKYGVPVYKFEDLRASPSKIMGKIMKGCGLSYKSEYSNHIVKSGVDRYKNSTNQVIKNWRPNKKLISLAKWYGYENLF